MRILVAEDNPANRELIREILEVQGYEVLEAANGLEALEQIEEKLPDLVLMDIQMPLIDGLEAVSKLRRNARFSKLPVVALTAYAMSGDEEKALMAGFNGYLPKPMDVKQLLHYLEQFTPPDPSRKTLPD
ncbi:MAG TPA: response regulator [Terriglobales bacterium]|nr:response regulator [Terriglobales bacterium]